MSKRPLLIASPRDDRAFRDLAEQLVTGGADTPTSLQAALRTLYPQVVVRPRELSAESEIVWYVYRDGRWTRPGGPPRG